MTNAEHLESAAIRAHRRGACWAEFWEAYGCQTRAAEPYDAGRYRKLVAKLLHLVASGDESGQEPAGEPWLLDDVPPPVNQSDTSTAARVDWQAAGIALEAVS